MIRIAIVGLLPFPEGGAPTSRLRSISLGLMEAGTQVKVFAFQSAENLEHLEEKISWHGIDCSLYKTSSNAFKSQHNITFQQILKFFGGKRILLDGFNRMFPKIEYLCKNNLIDAVIFYNQDSEFAIKLIQICKKYNIKYFQLFAELQLLQDITIGLIPYWFRQQIHIRKIPSLSNGNIVITSYLQKICMKNGANSTLIIPAITNTEIPINSITSKTTSNKTFTFTYSGMGGRRDNISLIIDAASILKNANYSFKILLIGLNEKIMENISIYVRKLGLENFIEINGWVSDSVLWRTYQKSDAFLLLRTNDQSSKACFPTRLPEYLTYGKPVILSAVGDFLLYFNDMENALFVNSNNAREVSKKMALLIEDHELGIRIGKNGRELVNEVFHYRVQGKKLYEYINMEITK